MLERVRSLGGPPGLPLFHLYQELPQQRRQAEATRGQAEPPTR